MAIPIALWVITGLVILTKPGYKNAYEQLSPNLYLLAQNIIIPKSTSWSEAKLIRTILGHHLLVISKGHPKNLDPLNLYQTQLPSRDQLLKLVNDSTSNNPQRYGKAISVSGHKVTTDTGVVISVDWNTMKFQQQGSDTRLINTLYKIHYLQWLPEPTANKIFGGLGLLLLLLLMILGIKKHGKSRT